MTSRPYLFDLDRVGAGLRVAEARDDLERVIDTGSAVVTAPPGTGKTTFVPPLVANRLAAQGNGRIVVTQPRRVAVRAAARRIAQLDGSKLGGSVGFTVRGERVVTDETRIEVVTPGVLLRRLLSDPGLDDVDAVILDEVHERSLDGDLLLGILAEVRGLRGDLTLMAMSATLDAAAVADVIGGAVVDVPNALHPLVVDYVPPRSPRLGTRGVTREFLDHLADVATDAQATDACDALVFVPSARDVDNVVSRIRARTTSVHVLPLHGRLPPREQDRATSGRAHDTDLPRIVVSTALAESSLTVPGVRLVVDAGLSREVRRDQTRDMSGLVTVSASRASAEQRAGRAARQGPGRVVRAYSESEFAAFRPSADPEIQSADLTDAALLLAAWGTPRALGLPLLTPPPGASVHRATAALTTRGLIDDEGRITPFGSRVARLPLGAREGRALLTATSAPADGGHGATTDPRTAAEVIAAISGDLREPGADLTALLRNLRRGITRGADRWRAEVTRLARMARKRASAATSGSSAPDTEALPTEAPDTEAMRAGTSHPRDARSAAGSEARPEAPPEDTPPPDGTQTPARPAVAAHYAFTRSTAARHASAGSIAALARPEWIARRVAEGSRTYLFASGTRAALPEGSSLIGSEWIAVCDVQRADGRVGDGTGAVIRLAAALIEDEALAIGGVASMRRTELDRGKVRARQERRLGAIVLSSTPAQPRPDDTAGAVAAHIRERGVGALAWSEKATSLRRRLALVHRELSDPWPDVSEDALLARLDEWLGPDLATPAIDGIDVAAALQRILPWPEASRLATLAPERLAVPSGSNVRIDYPEDQGGRPVVAVKLQEAFGLAETPRIVDGRVSVQFHLLSPARHPLAVTDDLASFWSGPYADVRKQMRGRYPKHPWPEDPWTAPATARTNRALRGR